ncbi:MAG: NAD(+)/NADH kinase [Chloroflexia bacterium]
MEHIAGGVEAPQPHRAHRVGLLYASGIEAAQRLGRELEDWLTRLDIGVWRGCADETLGRESEEIASCDLLFTLGGDGTALRGAHLAAPLGVPLVCVGLGRLSFMAELTPEDVLKEMPAFLAGDYWLERRALLEGSVLRRGEEKAHCLVLNEVVLARERCAMALRVAARVNGDDLDTYVCDAVIVATATGSTAYALSAGGPIVFPESRNMLLVPVAAHLSLLPPLVVPEDAWIELEILGESEAGVNADGQPLADLQRGDVLRVRRSPIFCYFARRQERNYFFRTLKERLYRREGCRGHRPA